MAIKYKVQSQLVTIYSPVTGGRVNRKVGALKGRRRTWERYKERPRNVADAVNYVTRTMLDGRMGGIVTVSRVPSLQSTKIFQAKRGTDGKPFVRWEGIAGDYWRREVKKINPHLNSILDNIRRHQ